MHNDILLEKGILVAIILDVYDASRVRVKILQMIYHLVLPISI